MALEKISAPEILSVLPKQFINVMVEQCLPSTNDHLLSLISASETILPMTAVLAETQTGGKGRQGRNWVSPLGNIYLSIYWPFNGSHDALYGLSLVIGIAIARVLKNNGLHDVQLKWPNDIYWQAHKMGGILIETKPNKLGVIDVIIGIGLNIVDMPEPQNITQKFACLENALGRKVSRNNLIAELLNEINDVLADFLTVGFAGFTAEWKQLDAKISSTVRADMQAMDKITYASLENF